MIANAAKRAIAALVETGFVISPIHLADDETRASEEAKSQAVSGRESAFLRLKEGSAPVSRHQFGAAEAMGFARAHLVLRDCERFEAAFWVHEQLAAFHDPHFLRPARGG